jgi:hypothetical protein
MLACHAATPLIIFLSPFAYAIAAIRPPDAIFSRAARFFCLIYGSLFSRCMLLAAPRAPSPPLLSAI